MKTTPCREFSWMAISFSEHVPECGRACFRNQEEAISWAKKQREDNREAFYILQYEGKVDVSFEMAYP
jgi:hypothetical protein